MSFQPLDVRDQPRFFQHQARRLERTERFTNFRAREWDCDRHAVKRRDAERAFRRPTRRWPACRRAFAHYMQSSRALDFSLILRSVSQSHLIRQRNRGATFDTLLSLTRPKIIGNTAILTAGASYRSIRDVRAAMVPRP